MVVNGVQINANCHPVYLKRSGNRMNNDNFLNPLDRFGE
jgi:hypothetical protein